MDSQSFVGDFGIGLSDNRYMNGLGMGGGGMGGLGGVGTNDFMNSNELDFSSTLMMMDSNSSLTGAPGSSTEMIDFPDELQSSQSSGNGNGGNSGVSSSGGLVGNSNNGLGNGSSNGATNYQDMLGSNGQMGTMGMTTSMAMPLSMPMSMVSASMPQSSNMSNSMVMSGSTVTSTGTTSAGAIPFPASLASDGSLSAATNTTSTPSTIHMPMSSNGMNGDNNNGNFGGVGLNGNAMAGNINMNPMSMPMGMSAGMGGGGYMPDMSMGMNPMFIGGGYPMQDAQANGMMMNMNNQAFFPTQQQFQQAQQQQQSQQQQQQQQQNLQQQQYMMRVRMLQQRQLAMQPQNAAATQQMQIMQMSAQSQSMANGQAGLQTSVPTSTAQDRATQPQMANQPSSPATQRTQRAYQGAVASSATHAKTGSNGAAGGSSTVARQPWHSTTDEALRGEMLNHITRVLQSQKANAPSNWLQRLPEMARRLEEECYRISTTREEYANTATLQTRLKTIVRIAQQRGRMANTSSSSGASSTTVSSSQTSTTASQSSATSTPIPFPGVQAIPQVPTSRANAVSSTSVGAQSRPQMMQQNQPQPIMMPPELNHVAAAQPQAMKSNTETPQAIPMPPELQGRPTPQTSIADNSMSSSLLKAEAATATSNNSAAAMAAANTSRSAQFLRQFKSRAQQVTSALEEKQTREYHNKIQVMVTGEMMNPSSKGVLHRQQQRLLLLRHAMWCKAPEGTCAATSSCGEMKRLWQHMGNCQETTSCSYSHCISSKYVLSHFQQCENTKCLVCQLLRFPVEVKEKNGLLMMDTDRALLQIQVASERRQAKMQPTAALIHNRTGDSQLQPSSSNAIQQQQGGRAPGQQQVGGRAGAPIPSNSVGTHGVVPASVPSASTTGPSPGASAVVGGSAATLPSSGGSISGLSSEEKMQLTLIQQQLRNVTLDQLNQNCKKLELYAEQVHSQINAVVNECRQLLHMSSSTPDPSMKSEYEAKAQEKKTTLQDLRSKYRKCSSQHRVVKHVINARMNGGSIGAATGAPTMQTSAAQVNTSEPMNGTGIPQQPQVNMHPLSMPAGLQNHQPTVSQPPTSIQANTRQPQLAQLGNQSVPQSLPLSQSFPAPSEQANTAATQVHHEQRGSAMSVMPSLSGRKLSPDDIMEEDTPIVMQNVSTNGTSSVSAQYGNTVNERPLEMPSTLQATIPVPRMPTAVPAPVAAPTDSTSRTTGTTSTAVPTSVSANVNTSSHKAESQTVTKSEVGVNPLTMNNSKLNAMMMEHKRMDAAKVKVEPCTTSVNVSENVAAGATAQIPSSAAAVSTAVAPVDVPTSMLNELSNEDLKNHIESLVTGYSATIQPAVLKKRLEGLLKGMMEHKFGWVFSSPVEPLALGIPNYFKIIRRPMDLGTIKKKLDAGVYKHMEQFAEDVRLTFENAKRYNSEDQDVYNLAKDMLNDFNAEFKKLEVEVQDEERLARKKESSCRLCGVERMVFEPAVLYCNGECNSRIRRNCYYYCAPDNKYHCCQPCFNNLPDTVRSTEGKSHKKSELTKKKNDEVHEEPWVQCDKCNRWVHQICALFNGKIDAEKKPQVINPNENNSGGNLLVTGPSSSSTALVPSSSTASTPAHSISSTPGSEFLCPECLLDHRQKEPEKYRVGKHAFNARDLMRTKLSDFLERRIYKALQEEREDEAKWTNRDVKDVETAEHLTVRLVSNIEKQLMVRDKMFQRYKDSHKYMSEHRFKSKCICMFQEIHGVSVLLFGIYVHEFDEQEADCNARRVYISYLDSVNYFEPAHLRTKVYHVLLIAYLDYVRHRGFHTAHLWACPPLKGDDYILYCHPEAQKTPKSDRLRQWYVDMLTNAQKEGVVLQITNLYEEYWRDDNTACALPYFEGDYWVGLAEEAIEKLDAEKPKKSKKTTSKRKAGSAASKRSNKKSKSKKSKRRKTGGSSVAAADKDGAQDGAMSDGDGDGDDAGDDGAESADDTINGNSEQKKSERVITSLDDVDRTVSDPLMVRMGEVIEPMKDDFLVVKLHPHCRLCNKPVAQGTVWKDPDTTTELGLNPKTVQVCLCDGCYQKMKSSAKTLNSTVQSKLNALQAEKVNWPDKCADPDEVNDSEYFDTRQAFLSLCQGNHYQFDELRRAKHSSMMALYHLGNPNPNAYVYECNSCTRDINSGNRWHCHTCPDFDVCDACHAKETHDHELEKIPTIGAGAGANNGHGGASGALTDEQRRLREQRAKNVRLHMQLLVHASSCDGSCGSANCDKMKELMRHGAHCKQRALAGCTVCRRVWALLQLHARQCRQYECKVPRCHDLREHVRKLQLQQQLMDDRRRAAVTQQYRQMQNGQQPGGEEDSAGGA